MTDAEIVRTLAEKCMGWEWHKASHWMPLDANGQPQGAWESNNEYRAGKYWNPLTSIADAFMVVSAILARDKYFRLELQPSGKATAHIWRDGKITTVRDDTQCRAICLAAIAALEGK